VKTVRRRLSEGMLLALALLLAGPALGEEKPRRIRVLATGKDQSTPILATWFTTEPSTDPVVFPTRVWSGSSTTPDDIRRFMRIYFPRSYRDLLEFEFFVLAQVDMTFFTGEQQKWIYDALTNYPKGGMNDRSIMSTHPWFFGPWMNSIISSAFPNDIAAVVRDAEHQESELGPLIINDDPALPDIMKSYKQGIEPLFRSYGGLNTVPKPGSVILSYTKNNVGLGSPVPGQIAHVFYWDWNASKTFTFRDMVYDPFWSCPGSPASNPYTLDIVANIVWFATGRELPDDPLKVHEYRQVVFDYNIRRSLVASLLDFAEMFGANPSSVYSKLAGVDQAKMDASGLYLDRDFDGAYEAMIAATGQLDSVEQEASKLKGKALTWVYFVEWLTTTGVLLVAGAMIWTLMVRRALYREVAVTKWSR